jgi:MFS family permease
MGVGAGALRPGEIVRDQRIGWRDAARALAAFAFGIPLGTAAGTLVGGLLAASYGWRTAFVVVGLLGLLVAPLLRLSVRDPVRGGLDSPAGISPAPAAQKAPPFADVLRKVFPKPSFWLLAFGAASSSVCGYGVAAWLPSFFMRSFGLSLAETAWYYAGISFLGGIAGIWLGGAVADRLGQRSHAAYPLTPAVCFLIAAPCFILAMNSAALIDAVMPGGGEGWPALTLAFLIFLIPTGLNLAWLGPITAAVQHLAPPNMRTTTSALFLLVNNLLGISVGIYYFGWMSDQLRPVFGEESLRWSIYTGMGFYVLSAVLLILASRTLDRDWEE